MRNNENTLHNHHNDLILKTYHSCVGPIKRALQEHHHTECELSIFISGSGTYTVGNKDYSFSDGDMFLFASNEAHCITDITSNLNLLNIQFEPRILWENADTAELLNIFNMRNSNFKNKVSSSDVVLKNLILDIEKELSQKEFGYIIRTKHLLFSALIHITRTYDYVEKNVEYTFHRSTTKKIKEAITYIDSNLDTDLTLAGIADHVCMAKTYFSSEFKKFNGISPWEYITIKRVEKAIKLIQNTNMTKLEIAEQCGFSSSSNFYKTFFNITGKKPSDYEDKK